MNLSIAQIYNKKSAETMIIVIGLFVLAGSAVFMLAAKNKSGIGGDLLPAENQAALESKKIDYISDRDNDKLPDTLEELLGTDSNNSDSDRDGYLDEEEIRNGYSPFVSAPLGKYDSGQFEKIKSDIKNYNPEVYENIFGKQDEKPAIDHPVLTPVISPAVSGLPAVSPANSPVPAVLKEKNINKDWAYILYVPPDLDRAKSYPLVMIFYGAGGIISDSVDNWRAEADKNSFIIAALEPYEKKYPGGSVVIAYPWSEANDFALSALRDIKKDYNIDEKNIFLQGYSTGAATAYIVALENEIRFKGVITVGGYLPLEAGIIDKLINSNDLNFYVIHGANDAKVKSTIAQEKTLLPYGAKMKFVTLPDFSTGEYPIEEQENIADWMNGLIWY